MLPAAVMIECHCPTVDVYYAFHSAAPTYYEGRTVVSPYVGIAQQQDGGSNECISKYTAITWLGAGVAHF